MSGKKYLIIVGGPTASGKTNLAIQLAQYYQTEIISCDSRQFFQELNIGTAKPDTEELAAAKHHFVGHLSIQENYTVGDFEQDALVLLDQLYEVHDKVILVGGSGLYIKALCEGLDQFPEVPEAIRSNWEQVYAKHGLKYLQLQLKALDPDYYKIVDLNNPHRLIRALSVCEVSGKAYSSFRSNQKQHRNFTPIYLQLHWKREKLYERINQRVDLMMQKGLLAEVQALYDFSHLNALQTVGYQEIIEHLEGNIALPEAIELIKRNSRRYAKRQLTWNRREGHWKQVRPGEIKATTEYINLVLAKGLSLKEEEIESRPNSRTTQLSIQFNQTPVQILKLHYDKQILLILEFSNELKATWLNELIIEELRFRAEERPIYTFVDLNFSAKKSLSDLSSHPKSLQKLAQKHEVFSNIWLVE